MNLSIYWPGKDCGIFDAQLGLLRRMAKSHTLTKLLTSRKEERATLFQCPLDGTDGADAAVDFSSFQPCNGVE